MKRGFNVVIERDEAGWYVASVPALPGCHTQARTLDSLERRIREAITLWLEAAGGQTPARSGFVGVQRIAI
jgi:predicted RNase H-like HicB family nuclease